jgi:site-specific DNA recombinase
MELQPGSKALADRLSKLESDQAELQFVLSQVSREPVTDVALPNLEELRSLAEGCFRQIAEENDEAGRLLNLMTPKLYIVPYRAIDNDAVIARAHITLHLSPLLSKSVRDIAGDDVLIRELVVDLNDLPQRVVHRHQVVSLRSQGLDQRQVGRMLGITQPAVQNALQLHSLMQQIGTADPYVPVHNVSECTSRLRRHKHARFRFEPLEGFPL